MAWQFGWVTADADIQSPYSLEARLKALNDFEGARIVVMGDSVALGKVMAEHGDENWREHTLAAVLAKLWQADHPGQPTLALNLALNGAVPADLEKLVELLADINIDLLVIDVAMRSYSKDFETQSNLFSRDWLPLLATKGQGRLYITEKDAPAKRFESSLSSLARTVLPLYALRDNVRERFFDGEPREALSRLIKKILVGYPSEEQKENELFDLLLKSQRRYETVNFEADNPQRQATERMLDLLRTRKQKTVVFYTKENPELIDSVMDMNRHAQWLEEFAAFIAGFADSGLITYIPPIPELNSDLYLDISHVNAEGYQILGQRIWAALKCRN